MPKVSVIIPIYNVEKYLRECLDSVINQTLEDIEIICVDDGGKDNCPQIIDEYAQKDSRIIPVHKENGGYGHSCNRGLETATGEYVAIVEPDDYIDKNMFYDLYEIAKQYNSDIVKSKFLFNYETPSQREFKPVNWNDEDIPVNKSFTISEYPNFLYYHPSVWTCIYKNEFLKKHNIKFIEAPGAGWTDNPFQVQTMCLAERINYTPNTYYYWRVTYEHDSLGLRDYALPFKRSDEIHEWLEKNKINDSKILSSLYERELNYINIVLGMNKISNWKDCKIQIRKMLGRMDKNIIANNEQLSRNYNKLNKTNLKVLRIKAKFKIKRHKIISLRIKKNVFRLKFGNININWERKQNA